MTTIRWPIFSLNDVTPAEFTAFWEQLYSKYDEGFYRENIGQPLTEERIFQWFKWKNGGPLSVGKANSIRRYLNLDERVHSAADDSALLTFLNRPGGAVWRIFWLHLQYPDQFPIYDQHVHRAMAFLLKWADQEIPRYDRAKVRMYVEVYRPFVKRMDGGAHRRVDRALWTFGRFLSQGYLKGASITDGAHTAPGG